ncbi:hypothetical protein KIH31_16110 [Paenarthrobacter sp. DKR-5]|uniref:FUSC family protein n=1 Tax=Paenarthrobacter sp. DKR-5 TaxID=2835535 RepID=UPI001BDC2619|nr:aromatic acid exporter family protein [Paenarthrobacter sp. DKR-5]MBT1004112.1 hypothetical protein [Paenarthrobacter sp. DKR-5]
MATSSRAARSSRSTLSTLSTGRAASAARNSVRAVFAKIRLELAAKTALAAGLAWLIAPLMPGPAAHYPYYAPLGALVSMYPTVADSAKRGMQSLLGLILGIGVAFTVASFTGASALAVAAVVGIGVLIGGLPRMGAASDWVPMAALFVLVIGGNRADSFSAAYVLQMAVGVGIGFAVNWLILPPLHFQAVSDATGRQREALSNQLDDIAAAMTESWPPDHEDWASRSDLLSQTASEVRQAVHQAELSAKANPRRRRHPRDLQADVRDLRAIERVTFHVRDITDVLSSAIWGKNTGATVPPELTDELSAALSSNAELLRNWDNPEALEGLIEKAQEAVNELSEALHKTASLESSVNATASVAMSLRRIVGAVRLRAEQDRDS